MRFEVVFVLWAMRPGSEVLLPSGFLTPNLATFWSEIFAALTNESVLIDAVPAAEFYQQLGHTDFAAAVSEEAFYNAWGNLEDFCRNAGGLKEGVRVENWIHPDGAKFQRKG